MTLKKIASSIGTVTVSMEELNKAFRKVRQELWREGLLWKDSPLDEVNCYRNDFPISMRWDYIESHFAMGYCVPDGDIHIPHFYPAVLIGREERDVVDTLRHEFGHALADRYKKHFRGVFRKAFGRAYGETPYESDVEDWSQDYVSDYATTATQEDWAETFMFYLKYKGKLPRKFAGKPAIERKWNAVAQICKAIAAE